MKYPWLYVGCKLVCVKASDSRKGAPLLHEGAAYTVASVGVQPNGVEVALKEMPPYLYARDQYGDKRWYFDVRRFRPVLPDTTKQVEELKKLMLKGRVEA